MHICTLTPFPHIYIYFDILRVKHEWSEIMTLQLSYAIKTLLNVPRTISRLWDVALYHIWHKRLRELTVSNIMISVALYLIV